MIINKNISIIPFKKLGNYFYLKAEAKAFKIFDYCFIMGTITVIVRLTN